MEKFSQKELLQEGFLDAMRKAGSIVNSTVKKVGRGIASTAAAANKLDREGFNVLKDPFKRFLNSDPKAAFWELMKKNYSKTFDIKTIKNINVVQDANAATSGAPALPGTPALSGTPATPATPPGVILTPGGLPATPGTPALSGTPGTPGTPATPALSGTPATKVSGRTIVTFTARQLITTGGSSEPKEYKAILSRNPENDPNNMFSMRVFDETNHEIQGTKTYTPNFNKIVNTFDQKYPNTKIKTDGTLTTDEAKKLIDMIYIQNHRVFDTNEQGKFSTLLSTPVVKLDDIKTEMTRERLVEKTNVSQKVLLEQLKSLS